MSISEKLNKFSKLVSTAKQSLPLLDELEAYATEIRNYIANKIRHNIEVVNKSKVNEEGLQGFLNHYWTVEKVGENEYNLIIPRAYDASFGWLVDQDEGFNKFRVNAITNWLGELPEPIRKELNFEEPFDITVQGDYVIGKDIEKVKHAFPQFVKQSGDRLLIRQGTHFDLLCELARKGTMPFKENPVSDELFLKRPVEFELHDYQLDIVKEFLKRSHVGVFIPTGTGKTYIALDIMSRLKPPYLIFCPKTLIEQWTARIEALTQIKPEDYEIYTYQKGIRMKFDKEYSLVIFDETHRLPAERFSELYRIPRHCTLGLSGTPFREDGNERMIIALTGYPTTMRWDYAQKLGVIQLPDCHIWIVKRIEEKYKILDKLIKKQIKSFIYSDSLDLGKEIASRYNIPFVHGQSKDRLKTINENLVTVVSRVADEGISNEQIEQIIEMDWLGSSRRQSLQRVGRLTHNQEKTIEKHHHIIMTMNEWFADRRRVAILAEKGFQTFYHTDYRQELEAHTAKEIKAKRIIKKSTEYTEPKPPKETIDLSHYPLLKYEGTRNIIMKLNRPQRKVMLFLIDPQNQNQSFTVQQLALNLGYTSTTSLSNNPTLSVLVKKGYIKNEDGKYSQNLSS